MTAPADPIAPEPGWEIHEPDETLTCTNPQPIPVRLGTEAVQILDTVFPPEQCDLEHADRAILRGSNMVPDERWGGAA